MAMLETRPHLLLHCHHCGAPISLRVETLLESPEGQVFQAIGIPPLAVVCPHCKHVRSYSTEQRAPDYDPTAKLVAADRTSDAAFCGSLKCDVEDCRIPLPLYALENIPSDPADRRQVFAKWIWDDVRCRNGDLIRMPDALRSRL